jgi:hypothetical protein
MGKGGGEVKMLASINFNTDTIRIGMGLRTHEIDIETDHGPCVETRHYSIESREGIIITNIRDITVLGVQDEKGN